MKTRILPILLVLAVAGMAGPVGSQEGKVELTTVKYSGLRDVILKNRGKVILVDVWAEY